MSNSMTSRNDKHAIWGAPNRSLLHTLLERYAIFFVSALLFTLIGWLIVGARGEVSTPASTMATAFRLMLPTVLGICIGWFFLFKDLVVGMRTDRDGLSITQHKISITSPFGVDLSQVIPWDRVKNVSSVDMGGGQESLYAIHVEFIQPDGSDADLLVEYRGGYGGTFKQANAFEKSAAKWMGRTTGKESHSEPSVGDDDQISVLPYEGMLSKERANWEPLSDWDSPHNLIPKQR
jgi:hypothetical protein